jgi:hypothetical protein
MKSLKTVGEITKTSGTVIPPEDLDRVVSEQCNQKLHGFYAKINGKRSCEYGIPSLFREY